MAELGGAEGLGSHGAYSATLYAHRPTCSAFVVRTDPTALDGSSLDILVIGGGIQGAAMAREAALRGASVLLAEKTDFGWATSSSSSRLIHGGLRYLEQGHISLVREALHERERLLRFAPHLVRPQPMLMPFFDDGSKRPWMVKMGLRMYSVLAGRNSMPGPKSYKFDDCLRLFPGLRRQGLRGGALFYDARTEDQRLTTAVVESAHACGAQVANYLEVLGIDGDRVRLRDRVTDAEVCVRAGLIINAAGPQVDAVRRCLGIEGEDLVRWSRGSHVVLDPMPTENALAAFLPDQRIQFVIPHTDGTICGTTEVEEPRTEVEQLGVPEEDIVYLIDALGWLLESPPKRADLRFGYSGWRALPTGRGPAGGLNREAFLVAEPSAAGPVHTAVGGKLTTHRAFAERSIDRLLDRRDRSPSREMFLPGGEGPQDVSDPLWWRHGSRAARIRALATTRPELLEPICEHRPFLAAEAVFAIREQGVVTFADLVGRRLFHSQGPCGEAACLERAFALFHEHVDGVGSVDRAAEFARVEELLQRGRVGG